MPQLTAAQKQVQVEFLQQAKDGCHNKSVAESSGLPNIAYTSADFYALEQNTVFRNNWVFAGFAHQLDKIGDMMPVKVADQPIVLVMAEDNKIRAFHNVCQHRGAQLVTESKRSKKFVCPNHSWSYSLEGKLIARPHFHGGEKHDVNHAACHRADLLPIRCTTWHDWIFVNISGNADSFESSVRPIEARLDGYDFGDLHFFKSLEFDLQANWKLAVENFIEPYHVFSCHPWLNDFVGMDQRQPPEFDDNVLFCGYQFHKTDPVRGGALPWFPNLPKENQDCGDWFVMFPNFAFEIFPDQVVVFIASPLGPQKTLETISLYFIGEGAKAEKYAKARDLIIQNWTDLNHEDIGIVERMQSGRASDGFDGGVLSPYWDPVQHHFACMIIQAISN